MFSKPWANCIDLTKQSDMRVHVVVFFSSSLSENVVLEMF